MRDCVCSVFTFRASNPPRVLQTKWLSGADGENSFKAVHGRHEHLQEPAVAIGFAVGALPPRFEAGVSFPGLEVCRGRPVRDDAYVVESAFVGY